LCGGTHIAATGHIGRFHILSESSIAAGVRRIEAVTAEAAEKVHHAQQDLIRDLRGFLHNTPDLAQALKKVIDENTELKKRAEEFLKEKAKDLKKYLIDKHQEINGIRVFVLKGSFPAELVKDLAFQIKGEFPEKAYFAAATETEGKPLLTVMISDDLVKDGWNAGQIVREAAKHIHGGGGGQAHFATAGGKDVDGLERALEEMMKIVSA
jgi:alanyl-tRNA synthetase